LLGAAAGAAVAAAAIALVARTPRLGPDTSVAIVITTLFGLGVVLALSPSAPPGVRDLLFGDLLGVTWTDVAVALVLGGGVLVALALLHRRLLAVGFDRATARALGGRPALVDLLLLGLLGATIVIGVQSLGNLLVLAVIVAPAATARALTRRIGPMMAVAGLVAAACAVGGLYLSYYASTASGASVAAVMVAVYLAGTGRRRWASRRTAARRGRTQDAIPSR